MTAGEWVVHPCESVEPKAFTEGELLKRRELDDEDEKRILNSPTGLSRRN